MYATKPRGFKSLKRKKRKNNVLQIVCINKMAWSFKDSLPSTLQYTHPLAPFSFLATPRFNY